MIGWQDDRKLRRRLTVWYISVIIKSYSLYSDKSKCPPPTWTTWSSWAASSATPASSSSASTPASPRNPPSATSAQWRCCLANCGKQSLDSLLHMIVQASSFYLHLKAWVLMAGFTLSFGSMFSKTWRVHSIFTNVQLNKKVCKETRNASHMTSLLEHQPNILFRYFISWFWLAYILYFRRVFFILQSREPQLA